MHRSPWAAQSEWHPGRQIRRDPWAAVAGLLLDVTAAPGYPGLRVQVTSGRRLLVRQGSAVVLLARLDAARRYVDYLRLAGYQSAIPPFRAAAARRIGDQPDAERDTRWAYQFVDLLTETDVGPLYTGRWLLQTTAPYLRYIHEPVPAADRWSRLLLDRDAAELDWFVHGGSGFVVALRPMSAPAHARVKAYRKQVRDGSMPPILLWWVTSLDCYLLLDGHDRLAACMAESVEPPLMTLTAVLDADEVDAYHRWSVQRHLETVAHIGAGIAGGIPSAPGSLGESLEPRRPLCPSSYATPTSSSHRRSAPSSPGHGSCPVGKRVESRRRVGRSAMGGRSGKP